MNFIDYLIYTKNYSALNSVNNYVRSFGITKVVEKPKDVVNLLRDDKKLTKSELKRKEKLAHDLSIASSIATLGYVGVRLGNYLNHKLKDDDSDSVDENLTDIQDE